MLSRIKHVVLMCVAGAFLISCASQAPTSIRESVTAGQPYNAVSAPASVEKKEAQPLGNLAEWLEVARKEASARGVSDATWQAAMDGFEPNETIVKLDRKQPEGSITFKKYLSNVVNEKRIRDGQKLYAENKYLLDEIAESYQVPAQYIVALWGIETSYGKVTGNFSVPKALATLAYEGRRAEFFREEFMKSLLIIEQGHITAEAMKGSWAGAMGQSQFMPSAFMDYAVDYDGDGHKDIWSSKVDVFASIANYLHSSGWVYGDVWAEKVKLPKGFDYKIEDIKTFRPVAFWKKHGITRADGSALPAHKTPRALYYVGYTKEQPREAVYLMSNNNAVLMKWNKSRYFATAVGILADAIKSKDDNKNKK